MDTTVFIPPPLPHPLPYNKMVALAIIYRNTVFTTVFVKAEKFLSSVNGILIVLIIDIKYCLLLS
jgi:hypothetical protein